MTVTLRSHGGYTRWSLHCGGPDNTRATTAPKATARTDASYECVTLSRSTATTSAVRDTAQHTRGQTQKNRTRPHRSLKRSRSSGTWRGGARTFCSRLCPQRMVSQWRQVGKEEEKAARGALRGVIAAVAAVAAGVVRRGGRRRRRGGVIGGAVVRREHARARGAYVAVVALRGLVTIVCFARAVVAAAGVGAAVVVRRERARARGANVAVVALRGLVRLR